ncbi:MAG TPA: DinB family protein, partial [Vicinamibacteria bacterium]|nr:DinB family protein [Vicinamibacteria bacterium]
MAPEAWLSGPVEGVAEYLLPVVHALVQVRRDLEAAAGLTLDQLWARPGDAASVGFHLRHVAGVLDRLLTYARTEELTEEQMRALRSEGQPGEPPADAAALIAQARAAIDRALEQVRATTPASLLEPRAVGRQRLPSTVLGLLYHAAEHA